MLRGNSGYNGGFISISDTALSELDPNELCPPSPLPSRINVFVKQRKSLIIPNPQPIMPLCFQAPKPQQPQQTCIDRITVNSIKSTELIQTPTKNLSFKRIKTAKNRQPLSPSPLSPTSSSKGKFSFEPKLVFIDEKEDDLEDLLFSPIKKKNCNNNYDKNVSLELHDHLNELIPLIEDDVQLESAFMSPIYNRELDFQELEDILLSNDNDDNDDIFKDIKPSTPDHSTNINNRKREEPIDELEEYHKFLNSLQGSDASDDENDIFELKSNNASGGEESLSQLPEKIETREILELFEEEESFIRDAREAMLQALFLEEEQPADFEDESFIKRLIGQINLHLQLLVQNLAFSSEIINGDKVWIVFLKLLIHFVPRVSTIDGIFLLDGVKNILRIINQSPKHSLLLGTMMSQSSIISDPDLMLRASVSSIKLQTKHPFVPNLLSEAFWKFISLFDKFPYPELELKTLLNLSNEGIINIRVSGKRSDSFLEVEDSLLLLGLRRFGLGNWEKIQSTFLPTRTSVQIATRYKNLTNRRASESEIKKFAAEATRALSAVERGLLMQGVRTYGHDWKRISQRFLPHRAASVLEKIWNKHLMIFDAKTIINTQFDSDDDNDDSDYMEDDDDD